METNSMKKTNSMSKDASNLSKSQFGCYFCCSFVNVKNLIILIWNGLFVVREKVEEKLF